MYHRFHAPAACRLREVTHITGDTWNVNPIALKRVEPLVSHGAVATWQRHPNSLVHTKPGEYLGELRVLGSIPAPPNGGSGLVRPAAT